MKTTQLSSPFNVHDYLTNDETDPAVFLAACAIEDPGDGSLVRSALSAIVELKGTAQIAKKAGISHRTLIRALSAEAHPRFETIFRISRALNIDCSLPLVSQHRQ